MGPYNVPKHSMVGGFPTKRKLNVRNTLDTTKQLKFGCHSGNEGVQLDLFLTMI